MTDVHCPGLRSSGEGPRLVCDVICSLPRHVDEIPHREHLLLLPKSAVLLNPAFGRRLATVGGLPEHLVPAAKVGQDGDRGA